MRTEVTRVTERGQVSIPSEVRKTLGLTVGRRLRWEIQPDRTCLVAVVEEKDSRVGAAAMRGFARTFRKTRATSEWMRLLREGEGEAG